MFASKMKYKLREPLTTRCSLEIFYYLSLNVDRETGKRVCVYTLQDRGNLSIQRKPGKVSGKFMNHLYPASFAGH